MPPSYDHALTAACVLGPRKRCRVRALRAFGDRVDLVGDEPVRLAVHDGRGVGVRGVDQAEDLAVRLIDPVAQVLDTVTALGLQASDRSPACGIR
jgi:hypothetical protein